MVGYELVEHVVGSDVGLIQKAIVNEFSVFDDAKKDIGDILICLD